MLLQDDRKKYGIGGVVAKLFKLGGKKAPAKPTSTDIDKVLKNLTDKEMEKLSPIEIEQLLDMDLAKSGVDNMPKKSTKKNVDDIIGNMSDKEMAGLSDIEIEQLLDMDLEKYGRKGKMMGGMLDDDRQKYGMGSLVKKLIKQGSGTKTVKVIKDLENNAEKLYKIKDEIKSNKNAYSAEKYNDELASIDSLINNVNDELRVLGVNPRARKAEGGMLPDETMEENYSDFVINNALSPEEEDMLMTKLEQDNELSMLFDKVIETAQEFAGNGPVEGPGTGVSDDIPARLSDGEFVFTAKAVEEIGEDVLMSMMKDAEAAAEGRQNFNIGGMLLGKEEQQLDQYGKTVDSNLAEDDIRKGMLSVNPRLNQR